MTEPKRWMQRTEAIVTGAALLVILVAYMISRFSGS
jgi:hypothetical protein